VSTTSYDDIADEYYESRHITSRNFEAATLAFFKKWQCPILKDGLVLDLGDTDQDLIVSEGDYYIDGTLTVNLTGSPSVNDYWDVWTILALDVALYDGSGVFDTINSNIGTIVASWVDVGTGNDTLRLTYIPEPATMLLLGLGSLIAVRRRKK